MHTSAAAALGRLVGVWTVQLGRLVNAPDSIAHDHAKQDSRDRPHRP